MGNSTDSIKKDLLQLSTQLLETLEAQEKALLSRNPKQVTLLSEQVLTISQTIAERTNSLKKGELKNMVEWGEIHTLATQCKQQYQRNQQHLEDLALYSSQLAHLLSHQQSDRYERNQQRPKNPHFLVRA